MNDASGRSRLSKTPQKFQLVHQLTSSIGDMKLVHNRKNNIYIVDTDRFVRRNREARSSEKKTIRTEIDANRQISDSSHVLWRMFGDFKAVLINNRSASCKEKMRVYVNMRDCSCKYTGCPVIRARYSYSAISAQFDFSSAKMPAVYEIRAIRKTRLFANYAPGG